MSTFNHIIVTVVFNDQLAATNEPVDSLDRARRICDNEASWENTVVAYAWDRDTGLPLYSVDGDYRFKAA